MPNSGSFAVISKLEIAKVLAIFHLVAHGPYIHWLSIPKFPTKRLLIKKTCYFDLKNFLTMIWLNLNDAITFSHQHHSSHFLLEKRFKHFPKEEFKSSN